jgi:hypothetical protein
VLTYSVGYAGSGAGSMAMAQYLGAPTLDHQMSAAARYYGGEVPLHLSETEELAQAVHAGEIVFSAALDELMQAELARLPADFTEEHLFAAEERITVELNAAITRADFTEASEEAPTNAVLRPDLSPALAERLGIDQSLPLTEIGVANLLNAKRMDGGDIEGKRVNKPMRDLADIFGLDPKSPPTGPALENVLASRRADGTAPLDRAGKGMDAEALVGPRRRLLTALGVKAGQEPSDAEMANIRSGKSAKGFDINRSEYHRQIHATKPPLGFVDLTFSFDKTGSVAFALAPSEAERAIILGVHQNAVADAMAFVEKHIGWITSGANGKDGTEPARMAWMSFQHYTARPAVDIAMTDADGVAYTERRDVPTQKPDPQLHSHVTVLASLLGQDSGRIGSLDLDRLDGFIHQAGAVYQARVAHHATQAGIEVAHGPHGEARFKAIPDDIRDLFSKRSIEAEDAARRLAEKEGLDWDTLKGPQKIALLKAGAGVTRNEKAVPGRADGGVGDFEGWREQAEARGYQHDTVLTQEPGREMSPPDQRQAAAYHLSQQIIGQEFAKTTTLDERQLKVLATRAFIGLGGISSDPTTDIEGVMNLYRKHGITQDGEKTPLEWGDDVPVRGKGVVSVTTGLHVAQERELVALMTAAAADKSAALKPDQIARAVDAFLDRNPAIDRDGPQWQAQREMVEKIAMGGRFAVAIGSAGSGKSTSLEVMVDAWKADGRTVYGATLAHRQATDLKAAGIDADKRTAIDAFLARADRGKYKLDRNSVVVVDEVSMLSSKQQLGLLRLQKQHGFVLAEVGDFAQLQSVDASAGVKLIEQVLPEMPRIITSIRQREQSERDLTQLFRDGSAAEGLGRKQADGTAIMVAGGRTRTVERVAQLWHERSTANPEGSITVSTVSNADVREIGAAIRDLRRKAGELGPDVMTVSATDKSGATYEFPLAIGDKVRLFDRVHDANAKGRDKVLAFNGSIVEVLDLSVKGMTVRNSEGDSGMVAWSKIQDKPDAPVRLTTGYATTLNLAQGITSTEHIHAPLDGSRSTNAYSAYVAMSRHKKKAWLVLNESAIRQQIAAKHVEGAYQPITGADVWRRAAADMNRRPERGSAIEMLERVAAAKRGGIAQFQRTMEPIERRAQDPEMTLSAFKDIRLAHVVRKTMEISRDVAQRVRQHISTNQQRPEHRGPSLRI